jgi:replication-associated recombination protein RarA
MNRFDAVQAAAKARSTNTLNTDSLARQIVTASDGDARMAYDFLDTLNAHVTKILQEKKQ